ncbi:helix-turn-helix transcriptional regulator [Pseudoalteromonas sp. MMG022]|uniref:helix-turn-helix transcriptional regulator n=1 Tax=Pseudoalteromonas sp. MMG022 TaxID=2909978 RepID=UPI001F40A4DA|nr:helix-turn-helix transcriptional regulator [Pseudoalteromonas sp. MMG022]MCF6435281.1 helix-turn-helix transcriptional regulator [Pseudoalteromonas sp. MMG022]
MKNNTHTRRKKVDGFRAEVQASIRILRHEKGWTQAQLAQKLNVDQASISNYESGKTDLSYAQLFELFLIFGKDITGTYFNFSQAQHVKPVDTKTPNNRKDDK